MFSLTKVKYVKDIKPSIKPCIRENNPEHVIIHVGSSELEKLI